MQALLAMKSQVKLPTLNYFHSLVLVFPLLNLSQYSYV